MEGPARRARQFLLGIAMLGAVAAPAAQAEDPATGPGEDMAGPPGEEREASDIDRDTSDDSLPISSAKIRQSLKGIEVTIRMRNKASLRTLRALPPAPGKPARYICMSYLRKSGSARICVTKVDGRMYVGRTVVGANRNVYLRHELKKAKARRKGRLIKIAIPVGRHSGVPYGALRWRVISSWSTQESECKECSDRIPARGNRRTRVKVPRTTGCIRRGATSVLHGSRKRPAVALTFDDGPGPYTSQVAAILRRHRVRATFFMVGTEVRREPAAARALHRAGHELGNHSDRHEQYPARASMAATNRAISAATGFEPCVFRPPYGLTNRETVRAATSLGMNSIGWDVDPQDWTTPGSDAIASRVVGSARDGSIVLLHDAGGNRAQTVGALPAMIRGLKRRGFKLVTVADLLGYRSRLEV